MRVHRWGQNLSPKHLDRPWWRYSRGSVWFYPDEPETTSFLHLHGEMLTFTKQLDFGFKVSTSGEETLDLHLGLKPLCSLWGSIDIQGGRFRLPPFRVAFDVRWERGGPVVTWEVGPREWNAPLNAGWRRGYKSWSSSKTRRFLIGPRGYESVDLESVPVKVPLPEGTYPATVTLQRTTRTRGSRWPFTRPHYEWFAQMRVDGPSLPFPGRGENSWDCGQDGLVSCAVKVRFPGNKAAWLGDAIGHAVAVTLKDRMRYGRDIFDTGADAA